MRYLFAFYRGAKATTKLARSVRDTRDGEYLPKNAEK